MHLAQELIDHIFDDLCDDIRDLRPYALVCPAWLHKCRCYLFRRKVLLPPRSVSCFSPPESVPNENELYPVLLKSPHLAPYIKELKINEGQWEKRRDWIRTDGTLPLLLRMLNKLERIEFRRLEWDTLLTDLKSAVCSVLGLPTLVSIEIDLGHFAGLGVFADFLHHAKSLTSLSLTGLTISEGEVAVEEPALQDYPHQSRYLFDVRFVYCSQQLAAWFLGRQSLFALSRIHTLHISCGCDTGKTVNTLLRRIRASLKRLELETSDYSWLSMSTQPLEIVTLEPASRIEFLHVTKVEMTITNAVTRQQDSTWFPYLLSTLGKSNRLEVLKLGIKFPQRHEGGLIDWSLWKDVGRVLAGSHLQFLRRIDIDFWEWPGDPGSEWFEEICQNLADGLSLIRAAGVTVEIDGNLQ